MQFETEVSPRDNLVIGEFTLINRGKLSVDIREIKTSCSCVSLTKVPRRLQPGEEAHIRFSVTFGFAWGNISQFIVVSDGFGSVYQLRILIHRPLTVTAEPNHLIGKVENVRKSIVQFYVHKSVKLVKASLFFNDVLLKTIIDEHAKTQIKFALSDVPVEQWKNANVLKVVCKLDDGSSCERVVPIYIVEKPEKQ